MTDYSKEEEEEMRGNYEQHEKRTLYLAYLREYGKAKKAREEFNTMNQACAKLRYEVKELEEGWFRLYVKANLPFGSDQNADEELDTWYAHKDKVILWTKDKGFVALMEFEEFMWIQWWYTNPNAWGSEMREMPQLLKMIRNTTDKPIRYRTMDNSIMKNHSIEIAENEYEMVP